MLVVFERRVGVPERTVADASLTDLAHPDDGVGLVEVRVVHPREDLYPVGVPGYLIRFVEHLERRDTVGDRVRIRDDLDGERDGADYAE